MRFEFGFWPVLAAACVLVAPSADAAVWHVDPDANGIGTGRSWQDAWTKLHDIQWSHIRAGDVLELSGGPNGRQYSERLVCGSSGTQDAPITIRLGQANEHSGPVILDGLNVGDCHWISIDGARASSFAAPTNILQLRSITNNIGIFCASTNGSAIYLTAPVGVRMRWIGVSEARRGQQRRAHGIQANVFRRGATDFNEIRYCWIRDTDDDGIAWIGNAPGEHFGHQEVAFSIIERVGDDGIEASFGFSVHDCIIGPSLSLNGHPDGIQTVGSNWKIYNNEFHDFFNSWLRLQAIETNHHDVWVYNNLFVSGRYGDPKFSVSNTGIEVVQYADGIGEVPTMTWNRILICNNTFYGARRLVGGAIAWAKRDERTTGAFVHNVFVTNSAMVNNLVVECGRGVSANRQPVKSAPPWGRAVVYVTEECLRWDYNTVTGVQAPEPRRIGYWNGYHPTGESMARTSMWKHNSASRVKFADLAAWDFELAARDAARDSGADLSGWFDHDILNRRRGGPWDRGAFEAQP